MTAPAPGTPFTKDLQDLHLVYEYDARDAQGNPEKWRYEIWFFSEVGIGWCTRSTVVRWPELWQCNWLEETGTVVSLVYDIPRKEITTFAAFSKGHWENPKAAHGDKRTSADFERWRGLARIGIQMDRHLLSERADILETFRGKGDLEAIEQSWPTF